MSISASDGKIGKVTDIYFDDRHWAARYFVVDTGGWLEEREVLISPISVESVDWQQRVVRVSLSQDQVKQSPRTNLHQPVYRQHEAELVNYYGYAAYWAGPFLWGTTPYPTNPMTPVPPLEAIAGESTAAEPHLQSSRELVGYHLQGTDDFIGHLKDFLVDSESWAIRYIVVDTRNWWPGKHVVIPPQWIRRLEWAERVVNLDVPREKVEQAPEYDPSALFSRAEETRLYEHYQRLHYWE